MRLLSEQWRCESCVLSLPRDLRVALRPISCLVSVPQPSASHCLAVHLRPWTSLMAAVCSGPTCSPLQASMLRQEDWDCAPLSSAAFKEEIVAENPLFGWKKVRKTLLREKNFEWVYTGNHVKDIGIVTDKCQWLEKKKFFVLSGIDWYCFLTWDNNWTSIFETINAPVVPQGAICLLICPVFQSATCVAYVSLTTPCLSKQTGLA